MENNKKAILGFAIAMVFSLAFMQGMSTKSNNDVSMQQVSIGCGYMATSSEGGAVGAWTAGAAISGGIAINVATGGSLLSWNPVGWAALGVAGAAAL